MGSEIEIPETPNWLKELEAKRERRLRTKLGHELGAGAPCITCEEKCPGLDLHFWRKICKNCKCSKENHEVQDDDIYGWAQDELLGTKVNRLKRKIILPGRKDKEVELEWAPNGQKETIEKYLKSVPPELLPIKGSQAAQDRKQLLKKQIPVHDIDPTLCHELTEAELQKMQEYVSHIKQSSVGVGHLIQINLNKGKTHVIDKNDAMFLINNVPKGIVSSENVVLQGGDNVMPLPVKKGNRAGKAENEVTSPVHPSLKEKQSTINNVIQKNNLNSFNRNVMDPLGNKLVTEDVQVPMETCLRDLSYSYDHYPVSDNHLSNLGPSAFVPIKTDNNYNKNEPVELNLGSPRELPYPSQFINEKLKYGNHLPHYNPGNVHTVEEHQNPAFFQPIKDLAYPDNLNNKFETTNNTIYAPKSSYEVPYKVLDSSSPFRTIEKPSTYNHAHNQPKPETHLSNAHLVSNPKSLDYNEEMIQDKVEQEQIRPLYPAYSTYDSPPDGAPSDDFHNLSVKDRLNKFKQRELAVLSPRNSSISEGNMSPSKFSLKDRVMNLTQSFSNPANPVGVGYGGDGSPSTGFRSPHQSNDGDSMHRTSSRGSSLSSLPSLTPGNRNIHEDDLQPSYIPIGAIKDIEYENPDVRMALSKDNEVFEGCTLNKFKPDLDLLNLPCCHYCKNPFRQEELAIAIPERSDAIYHTECFKCNGCNQILADMFYFYDKSSNNIYCGRDYAKIRGIPRCMACDELIFVKEYCLAENSTFHVKHFCCFECDKPLANQNYVMENNQPVCIPCYELTKANKCYSCNEIIHPDQQGLQLKEGVHFHATEDCFACKVCRKSLFGAKLLFRNDCLYCSHDCYNSAI